MFTIFHSLSSKQAPQPFSTRLLYLLNWYQQQPQGQWLRSINIGAMKYCFCQSMTVQNGIMGAFSPLKSDTITLMAGTNFYGQDGILTKQKLDSMDEAALQGWAQVIAPTAIHQLRHKWQSLKYGPVIYTFLSFPFLREFTIESDADFITAQAQRLIQVKVQMDVRGRQRTSAPQPLA